MNKIFLMGILAFLSVHLKAKSDPAAKKLFQKIEQYYQKLKSFEVQFQIETTPAESKTKIEKGKYLASGTGFKIILPDHEIYCDGKDQWTYFKSRKEVQITKQDESSKTFQPTYLAGLYKTAKYDYRILEEIVVGGVTQTVIDLKPLDADDPIFKTKLFVNKKTNAILKAEFFQKNGDRIAILFKKTFAVSTLKSTDFQLDTKKMPGIHVEDLRDE